MKKVIYGMLSLCVLFVFLHFTDLDYRIFYTVSSMMHKETSTRKEIWLNDYVLAFSHTIPCLEHYHLSGITYCRQSRTLFVVTDTPSRVHEIDKSGICLRGIPLTGFDDTEGIIYLDGKRFAIIEETEHTLNIVEIDIKTTSLDRSNVINLLQLDLKDKDNNGFEGIAYDNVERCFYLVNEKRPMQLITIKGMPDNEEAIKISLGPDLILCKLFMDDFSGLHFDSVTRHLLIVSEQSKLVSEVSCDGEVISFLQLKKGFSGLKDDIPKAEGITMDDAGNIYIVSEPNLFYRFVRKNSADSTEEIERPG